VTVGRLFFAAGDEDADRAWNLMAGGHLTDVSIGYLVLAYTDIAPGQKAKIDGREFVAGDLRKRVVTQWKLREVSLVPIGADELAKVREAAHGQKRQNGPDPASNEGEPIMNKHLRQYLESLGLRADATEADAQKYFDELNGDQKIRAELLSKGLVAPSGDTKPEGERQEAPAPVSEPQRGGGDALAVQTAVQEALRVERTRQASILEAAGDDVPAELAQRAIHEGWELDHARGEFLTALRANRSPGVATGVNVISPNFDHNTMERGLAAGLMLQLGLEPVDAKASQHERNEMERAAEIGRRFTNMSLLDYCREVLAQRGIRARSAFDVINAFHDDAMGTRGATASLSNVFSTSVNAQVQRSYAESPDTTIGWCNEVDVANYMQQEAVRTSAMDELELTPENREAPEGSFNDNVEYYRVARYAKKFTMDEIAIVNDRFDVFASVPRNMGLAAARLRARQVYAILNNGTTVTLNDGVALFEASTHANYGTTSTAFAAATVQAGITAMGKQTTTAPDGSKVAHNIAARHCVVPVDLKFDANILFKSEERVISSASGGTYNPLRVEGIEVHYDNRIGVTGVVDPATGTAYAGTATNWYLFADPSEAEVMRVAYLLGTNRRPVVRRSVLTDGRWGLCFDIQHSVGAKAVGFVGAYKASGAGA